MSGFVPGFTSGPYPVFFTPPHPSGSSKFMQMIPLYTNNAYPYRNTILGEVAAPGTQILLKTNPYEYRSRNIRVL